MRQKCVSTRRVLQEHQPRLFYLYVGPMGNNWKWLSPIILALVLPIGLTPYSAMSTTTIGGLISSDLVLAKSGSPYTLSSTLQIPAGRTVTVQSGVEIRTSGVSTAGGAFLEFAEGKKLPAIEILERRF